VLVGVGLSFFFYGGWLGFFVCFVSGFGFGVVVVGVVCLLGVCPLSMTSSTSFFVPFRAFVVRT